MAQEQLFSLPRSFLLFLSRLSLRIQKYLVFTNHIQAKGIILRPFTNIYDKTSHVFINRDIRKVNNTISFPYAILAVSSNIDPTLIKRSRKVSKQKSDLIELFSFPLRIGSLALILALAALELFSARFSSFPLFLLLSSPNLYSYFPI